MRCTCPHCRERFDVPHRAVIEEAARLAARRRSGDVADVPDEVNGNVQPPADAKGQAARHDRPSA
jgi:hypothetical protein